MLDEKFSCDQIFIQHFFVVAIFVELIQHFIQHGIFKLDAMKDWFNKALRSSFTSTNNLSKNSGIILK